MKVIACLNLAALLVTLSTAELDIKSKVTPVQKVIQLLKGMEAKGQQEKHEEAVQYSRYDQFCQDTTNSKNAAIADANSRIEVLKADITKHTSDAKTLARQVAEGQADVAAWDGDMKAATKVHGMETEAHATKHKDLTESIDALGRAIQTLKRQDYNRPQAKSFAQVAAVRRLKLVTSQASALQALDMYLSQQNPEASDPLAVRAPEAHGYEFRSSNIVEVLMKLEEEFIQERTDLEAKDSERQQAYNMLMDQLKSSTAQTEREVSDNSKARAGKLQAKADADSDLTDTTSTRDADQTYVTDLVATCAQKGRDFKDRQQLRTEELEAIAKAVDILASGAVTGNADKHLPGLVQRSRATVFASLRADSNSQSQVRALQYLQARAEELHSRVLSAFVARSNADPFEKVKTMIKQLIVRLMEEANNEATHKGWCDTEMAKNAHTRTEKTAEVETLKAEIEGLGSSIATLTDEIADLTASISELQGAMKSADEMRAAEQAKNAETVQDAQEAQAAVAQALAVLNAFYEKAGQATALVQKGKQQPVAPEIFDSPYKGMQAENGGVIGMLEVVQTDFARLEAETSASEAASKKEHEEFTSESKIDMAAQQRDVKHKTSKVADEKNSLEQAKVDLDETQKVLDAALTYFDKLKPSCVDADVSYDDRVARRKAEIESLQEALRILSGDLP